MDKIRAVVDARSTTTLISIELLDKMPNVKKLMRPTSLGFNGMGEKKLGYKRMLYDLDL